MARGLYSVLYSALLWVLQPLMWMRVWWRGRREASYRVAIGERFGRYPADGGSPTSVLPGTGGHRATTVWLHAVSLGETRASTALIDELRARLPSMRLVLTHGTATGREAGAALLRPGDRQAWLPVDTPSAVSAFFEAFAPSIGVLMETEVWPNLIAEAHRRGVPVVLANARLSERSLRKGRRFEALLRPAVERLALVLAQTEDDARRLRDAGARVVEVAGNVKFDLTPDPTVLDVGRAWRLASPRPIVLAASTREGEEAPLLEAWRAALQAMPGEVAASPRLLIVPRHPQRFDEVAGLLDAGGWRWHRRSRFDADSPPGITAAEADVWLGDSMREMAAYYASARVALLGGSFEPLGGQNLIEAAACGCPVLCGPHTFNFADAAERAIEAGAAQRVAGWDEAVRVALDRCAEPESAMQQRRDRALAFAGAHRGAASRMAARIASMTEPHDAR